MKRLIKKAEVNSAIFEENGELKLDVVYAIFENGEYTSSGDYHTGSPQTQLEPEEPASFELGIKGKVDIQTISQAAGVELTEQDLLDIVNALPTDVEAKHAATQLASELARKEFEYDAQPSSVKSEDDMIEIDFDVNSDMLEADYKVSGNAIVFEIVYNG